MLPTSVVVLGSSHHNIFMSHKLVLPKYPDHIIPSRYNKIVDYETAKLLAWCKKQGIGYADTMPATAMKAAHKTGMKGKNSTTPMKATRGLTTPPRALNAAQKKLLASLKQKGKKKKAAASESDDDGDDSTDNAAAKKPVKQAERLR